MEVVKVMTLREVLEALNSGKTVSEIAKKINKKEEDLERKLNNAAIKYDSNERKWKYTGIDAEKSLSRVATSRVKGLDTDKPYIENNRDKTFQKSVLEENVDYILYKDYLNIDHTLLNEKKTFYLSEEMYTLLKRTSREKSLKINALLSVLLRKAWNTTGLKEKARATYNAHSVH